MIQRFENRHGPHNGRCTPASVVFIGLTVSGAALEISSTSLSSGVEMVEFALRRIAQGAPGCRARVLAGGTENARRCPGTAL